MLPKPHSLLTTVVLEFTIEAAKEVEKGTPHQSTAITEATSSLLGAKRISTLSQKKSLPLGKAAEHSVTSTVHCFSKASILSKRSNICVQIH